MGYSIGKWIDEDGDGKYDVLEVETRNFKGPRTYENSGMRLHDDNASVIKERRITIPRAAGSDDAPSRLFVLLSAGGQLVRSAGAGGAEKQLASVGEGEIAAVGAVRPVFRLVPIDNYFSPWKT
jgi:hypothetical protein